MIHSPSAAIRFAALVEVLRVSIVGISPEMEHDRIVKDKESGALQIRLAKILGTQAEQA